MKNEATINDPRDGKQLCKPQPRDSGWSTLIASLVFSAATFEMLVLYGIVHWQVMFRSGERTERTPDAVFTVLEHLWWLRLVFAILAVVWGIWSFGRCARWATTIALSTSLLALMTTAIMM